MQARRRVIVEDIVTHPIFVRQPAQEILLRARGVNCRVAMRWPGATTCSDV